MAQTVNGTINQDINPIFQPKGSTRFCLNGVLEAEDGMQGALMNEEGNKLEINFEANGLLGYAVIGAHRLNDQETVLFITNNSISIIAKQYKDGTLEVLVKSSCLNFKPTKRITAQSRVFDGCQDTVYFTDSYNPYRSINLDNLDKYLLPGETVDSANTSTTGWDCDKIKHFYNYQYPVINFERVKDVGGELLLGTYSFSVRYLDEDGNATNWTLFTEAIPVTSGSVAQDFTKNVIDSFNDNWQKLQGGINYREDQGVFVGTIKPTTKSIDISVANLDPSFRQVQFAVAEYVEDLQTPTNFYILETVGYTGTTVDYTYRGFNPIVHSAASEQELTILPISINKVHTHAQIDNRLFLANVTESDRNWSTFQQAACKIKSKWATKTVDNFTNIKETEITKRPEYYWSSKSYMRDEIYAFAIVYVFKDGTYSPPMHIPGTAADNTDRVLADFTANAHNRQNGGTLVDRQLLTVVTTPSSQTANEVALADVAHLGLTLGNTVERWKVFNTAIMSTYDSPYSSGSGGGTYSHNSAEGEMAFWETNASTYPLDTDCSGNYIYGADAWGTDLAGTPVRHHKFPDSTLIEHAFTSRSLSTGTIIAIDEVVSSSLGIQFTNVTIPTAYADEVQGYYIVRNHRDEFNSTVVDKGLFNNTSVNEVPGEPGVDAHYPPAGNNAFLAGIGSFQDSGKEGVLVSPMSLQGKWSNNSASWEPQAAKGDYIKFENVLVANNTTGTFQYSWFADTNKPSLNHTSRRMIDSVLVASNRQESNGLGFTHKLYNNNWMNDVNYISMADPVTHLAPVGQFEAWYAAVKRILPNAMGDLSKIIYYKESESLVLNDTSTPVMYGGDVFINNLAWSYYSTLGTDDPVPTDTSLPANDTRLGIVALNMLEENINLALRHYGRESYERHPVLRWDNSIGWRQIPDNWGTTDMLDPDTDALKRQWWALNPDYSLEPTLNDLFPLSITHQWCDSCEGSKPNYLYYSDQSSAFDIADNYRVFRALNVNSIFPEDGSISKLYVNKDRLFAALRDSLVFLPVKPQTLSGDGTTVFTGTGGVLSAPPKKLVSSDIGYAGIQDKFSVVTTEFGTVLVDSVRGKVFLHDQQLTEISNQGLRNWFRDHSRFILSDFILDYPLEHHYTNVNGFGYNAVYDPKYRRLLLHKKDYYPISTFGGRLPDSPSSDTLYYTIGEANTIQWYYNGIEVFDYDSTHFVNTSWTMSYSFVHKGWVSWHSYMPNLMWATSDTFYSYATALPNSIQGVYKHGYEYRDQSNNYQTYYGTKFPHMVEIVAMPNIQTGVYPEVAYKSDCFLTTSLTQTIPLVRTTFDQAWIYTDTQSSDYMDIDTYYDNQADPGFSVYNNNPSNNTLPVRYAEKLWRFNKFRDITTSGSGLLIASSDWNNVQSNYNQINNYQGFIDKVPNPTAHNPNVNQWEIPRFRNNYILVRLATNKPNDDVKFVTNLIQVPKYPSFR